ncbi:MAG: excisionase family DNA-binding protein [Anaerolineae bacterium]|nr:excisionase family DNA-binding protein [Anaerolineae bacterium]
MSVEGWITTRAAAELSGYAIVYIRRLIRKGRIEATRVGRDWLVNRSSLMAYRAQMEALGSQKYSPRREVLKEARDE